MSAFDPLLTLARRVSSRRKQETRSPGRFENVKLIAAIHCGSQAASAVDCTFGQPSLV